MWNKPTSKELESMPALYSSENIPLKEKMIYLHFFIGGSDWYAAEYSQEDELFFGFVILNNDIKMAEWGYFSLKELDEVKISFVEVDRDLHFEPAKAKSVSRISEAQRW